MSNHSMFCGEKKKKFICIPLLSGAFFCDFLIQGIHTRCILSKCIFECAPSQDSDRVHTFRTDQNSLTQIQISLTVLAPKIL